MDNIQIDKIAFKSKEPNRGFTMTATYLIEPKGDALIEIFREGKLHREFLFPSYKIYNLAAHWDDIIDGELKNNLSGYKAASWNGIDGAVIFNPSESLKKGE